MTKKEQFISEIEQLIKDIPNFFTFDALEYFKELKSEKASTGEMTELGLKIITWLQENSTATCEFFSAKSIGEGLFASSRAVSASARKLITDGYLTKEGQKPVTYALTDMGQSYGH